MFSTGIVARTRSPTPTTTGNVDGDVDGDGDGAVEAAIDGDVDDGARRPSVFVSTSVPPHADITSAAAATK